MKNDISTEFQKLINICHANLKNSQECLNYLQKREIPTDIITKYQIGYFPRNPNTLSKYVSKDLLQKFNILEYSGNSKFSEYFYLVFPLFSEYNEPIGIMGRTLLSDQERTLVGIPKYQNSSIKKSSFLFGLDKARSSILKNQNVFVVEGNFDQIALSKNGIKNSVAICGTAFSKNHMIKLARYTDTITFLLDRDDAGKKSMEKIYNKFSNKGIKLRFMRLPKPYKDIDEFFADGNNRDSFFKNLELYIPTW